jgi:hypothetical protein
MRHSMQLLKAFIVILTATLAVAAPAREEFFFAPTSINTLISL